MIISALCKFIVSLYFFNDIALVSIAN